mmetsp:Transcript_34918/g.65123  ORF Transcript_34918/g.65123 Transcript_34918/m.65123 type:complete len:173 (+) Transcript_34918:77-595(+)
MDSVKARIDWWNAASFNEVSEEEEEEEEEEQGKEQKFDVFEEVSQSEEEKFEEVSEPEEEDDGQEKGKADEVGLVGQASDVAVVRSGAERGVGSPKAYSSPSAGAGDDTSRYNSALQTGSSDRQPSYRGGRQDKDKEEVSFVDDDSQYVADYMIQHFTTFAYHGEDNDGVQL